MTRYRYVRRCCPGAFCVSTPNKTIVLVAEAPFDIAQDRVPMIGLVLVTHGRLADEFRAALEHVMGPQKQIEAITIGAEDDSDLCRSDMFGGTPSNLAISCMSRPKVEVLAGINLPMLVKLAKVREERSLPDAIAMAQEAGRKYVTIASRVLAGK